MFVLLQILGREQQLQLGNYFMDELTSIADISGFGLDALAFKTIQSLFSGNVKVNINGEVYKVYYTAAGVRRVMLIN